MARPTCLSLLGVRPLLRVFLSRPVFSSFFRVEPGRQMVNVQAQPPSLRGRLKRYVRKMILNPIFYLNGQFQADTMKNRAQAFQFWIALC